MRFFDYSLEFMLEKFEILYLKNVYYYLNIVKNLFFM